MHFGNRFSYFFSKLMAGRCGFDALSSFLLRCSLTPLLLSVLLQRAAGGYVSTALYILGMVLFVWAVWRAFSRSLSRRSAENQHFVQSSFYTGLSGAAVRFSQRKDYRFYRCPGCKRWLRVPRGRGTLEIRCPGCGSRFRKKT